MPATAPGIELELSSLRSVHGEGQRVMLPCRDIADEVQTLNVLGEELYLGVHDDLLEFSDPWLLLFLRILRYLRTGVNNGG